MCLGKKVETSYKNWVILLQNSVPVDVSITVSSVALNLAASYNFPKRGIFYKKFFAETKRNNRKTVEINYQIFLFVLLIAAVSLSMAII